jgi:hypothetical protein
LHRSPDKNLKTEVLFQEIKRIFRININSEKYLKMSLEFCQGIKIEGSIKGNFERNDNPENNLEIPSISLTP